MFDYDRLFLLLGRAAVLLTTMPIHECAHGYAACRLGDDTAKNQGRLSLNPFRHLDLFGSLLILFSGFGWAKPVPVDPRRFKNPRRDMALTALAGPGANLLLALVLMILEKLFLAFLPALRLADFTYGVRVLLITMIYTNLYLAVFNLLPVPPLDGSKIFGAVLPDRLYFGMMRYERIISVVLIALVFTGILSRPLSLLAQGIFNLFDWITTPFGRIL